jgi:hypothetical protein
MNRVPGKCRLMATLARTSLWLGFLLLSSQAMAQPPAVYAPGYYPRPLNPTLNPWAQQQPYQTQPPAQMPAQTPVQPQVQQTQTAVQLTPPGPVTAPFPAPVPATPSPWNNSWQQQYSVYYSRQQRPPRPTTFSYPQAYPQSMQAQPHVSAPYLETRIENTSAYVYQNIVLTIDVISSTNISSASLQIQDSDDVILRQLGDITASNRNRQGQNEIVNKIYYLMTPLRSGDIDLPPLHVTGKMDSNAGYAASYDATATQPIHLRVSDPDPGVQPWLPLHKLELSASISNDEHIGEGKPLTLTVEQRAIGMSGSQLPSVENQLQGPDHHLYREKTEYTGVITAKGELVGTRSDRFTLVPQQGNRIEIPTINVDWWNIDRQRRETAVLQGRLLNALSGSGDDSAGSVPRQVSAPGSLIMWLVLIIIAFVLGRFSPYYMPGFKRHTSVIWQHLYEVSEPLRHHYGVWKVRLSPQRNMHLLRRKVANTLPQSARLWYCVRNADHEEDVDDWSQVLRFLVQRRLQLPAHQPMSKLAEHIIAIHPGSNPEVIRNLLNQLEAALFGGKPIEDFDAWKKAFKQQVRPRLFAGWKRRRWIQRESRLPELNPVVA